MYLVSCYALGLIITVGFVVMAAKCVSACLAVPTAAVLVGIFISTVVLTMVVFGGQSSTVSELGVDCSGGWS